MKSRRRPRYKLIALEMSGLGEQTMRKWYMAPDDERPLTEIELGELIPCGHIQAAEELHEIERAVAKESASR